MKKVLVGLAVIGGIVWVISTIGSATAIAWGFGLVIGAFLAILAIRALFVTSALTAVVAVNEAAKALTTPTNTTSLPKEESPLQVVNRKRASYGLPSLSSLEEPIRPCWWQKLI
jgi:hypothetical protein